MFAELLRFFRGPPEPFEYVWPSDLCALNAVYFQRALNLFGWWP